MAGFFDWGAPTDGAPGFFSPGASGQQSMMSNAWAHPGTGDMLTNFGLAMIAGGQGGGAPRSRFADMGPYLQAAVAAPRQAMRDQMMQKLYGAQLKSLEQKQALDEATNPLLIDEARRKARMGRAMDVALYGSGVADPAQASSPAQPSLIGPTVQAAAAIGNGDGPTVQNASLLPKPAAAPAVPGFMSQIPDAEKPFAMTNPQEYFKWKAEQGTKETWSPREMNGIPGQISNRGEWKPLDPTLSKVTVSPSMNMPPAESKFEEKYGTILGEQAGEIHVVADKSRSRLAKLSQLEGLLTNLDTGKLAETKATVGAWGEALGISSDTLSKFGVKPGDAMNAQAATAVTNALTTEMIGPGGFPANNFSEADRKFVQQTMPQISNTPGGNAITAQALRLAAERSILKEKEWLKARKEKVPYADFLQTWNEFVEKTPLFPSFTSPEQMKSAKKGTVFTAPDGSIRVVP